MSLINILYFQGDITATFHLVPVTGGMSFQQLLDCSDEMFNYVELHEAWGDGPILKPEPGCARLGFEADYFKHNGEEWVCN